MTAPPADLGPSWLVSLPPGARVLSRTTVEHTVATVGDGGLTARPAGRRRARYIPLALVPAADRDLVAPGARFWLVSERVALGHGDVDGSSAIRFRRSRTETAEAAFARDTQAGAR